VAFNSYWINQKKINTKKKKIKEGDEDDNAIAITAASSLLALVNRLNESNNFKQLDQMQNHMSNLITAQIDKKTNDSVAKKIINNKKDSEQNKTSSGDDSSSSSEYKKRPHRKTFWNKNFLGIQAQAAIVKAIVKGIVKGIRYTKTC